jgi:hypothetical protein
MLLYFFLSIFVAMFLFTYFMLRDAVSTIIDIARSKNRSYRSGIHHLFILIIYVSLWFIFITSGLFNKGFYIITHPGA